MQHSIWLGQQRYPGSPLYNMGMLFLIEGALDFHQFETALAGFVKSHEVMRSIVVENQGTPSIEVLPKVSLNLDYIDFSGFNAPLQAGRQHYEQSCRSSLDLANRNFEVSVGRLSDNLHYWYLNQHHLFTDIASLQLIFHEVGRRYLMLSDGINIVEPDSVAGVRNVTSTAGSQPNIDFGDDKESAKRLKLYGADRMANGTEAFRIEGSLYRSTRERLKSLMESPEYKMISGDLTQFCLMATGIIAYLSRICDAMDLTIACPAQGRASQVEKTTVGLFIEFLPFHVSVEEGDTFSTLYRRVQNASMDYLKRAATKNSDRKHLRDLNVVWNMIQTRFGDFAGLSTQTFWLNNGHVDSQHDLRIQFLDLNGSNNWDLYFDINKDVFDRSAGMRIMGHFCKFMDELFLQPSMQISGLSLVTDEEKKALIERSHASINITAEQPPTNILTAFRQHAAYRAGTTAARVGGQSITYAILDRESDTLATILMRIPPESRVVGVYAPRSIELLVAILAVLKSGSAFVPLDVTWPSQRVERLCNFANVDCVISIADSADQLPVLSCARLEVEFKDALEIQEAQDISVGHSRLSSEFVERLPKIASEDPAYIIFTSGSSGDPKGVVVNHGALSEYISWAADVYVRDDQPADFALHTAIGFDLTITSIFTPLWLGTTAHIYPESPGKADLAILEVIKEDRANVVKLTPAHLSLAVEMKVSAKNVHTLILGGENLSTQLARQAGIVFGDDVRVMNEYGPTEAVVGCMLHEFNPVTDTGTSVPIGLPAKNVAIYLLDTAGNPVPDGVPGEITIGGSRLAEKYLHDNALTNLKFIADPELNNQRQYRSGDLARVQPDGHLVYLGRQDNQVKIRGARIELHEVSSAISQHAGINECHVMAIAGPAKQSTDELQYCRVCGLASNYPGTLFDASGRCHICQDFEQFRDRANRYFKDLPEFREIVSKYAEKKTGEYDCLVLLSGGKDSTYALYSVVKMGFNVFAMTLDNGYISYGAKQNIKRSVDDLGIHHEFVVVNRMKEIFSDSLRRHNSVCYGCFKTIYTLAINIAHEHGIPSIVTGLSRGQFFETRLTREILEQGAINPEQVDLEVLANRKIYHRIPDKVTELLDMSLFKDDKIFDQIQFVDFYRYCDVSMDEMYDFLERHAPWTRPEDTGRSTNCLINDTGIHVHKQKLGFHNYALPYSWDVRLGHKERDAALEELDDTIDIDRVHEILQEVDYHEPELYQPPDQPRLVAYYTANEDPGVSELRSFLRVRLSEAMVPSYFVVVEKIPLTANGKIDAESLPDPRYQRPVLKEPLILPTTDTEHALSTIWQQALRVDRIGIHDNFFELGGDSIVAIQIVVTANQSGIRLTPNQVFQYQTVSALASQVDSNVAVTLGVVDSDEAFSLLDEESIDDLVALIEN